MSDSLHVPFMLDNELPFKKNPQIMRVFDTRRSEVAAYRHTAVLAQGLLKFSGICFRVI